MNCNTPYYKVEDSIIAPSLRERQKAEASGTVAVYGTRVTRLDTYSGISCQRMRCTRCACQLLHCLPCNRVKCRDEIANLLNQVLVAKLAKRVVSVLLTKVYA